jgi:predicted O-methyltransferase YrrM
VHLKYKFTSKLSLDFYIVAKPSMGEYRYDLYSNEKDIKYRNKPHGELISSVELQSRSVVECLWIQGKWIFLRYRHDRLSGNRKEVVMDVMEDMKTPIPMPQLFSVQDRMVQQYVIHLILLDHGFVFEHFSNQTLSLMYHISKELLTEWISLFFRYRFNLSVLSNRIPTDYQALLSIYKSYIGSAGPSEKDASYISLYSADELREFYALYDSLFREEDRKVFDVRQFRLFRENKICISKHGYAQPSSPQVLPPLPTVSPSGKFDVDIISLDPSYERFITIGETSTYSSLMPWQAPQVQKAIESWILYPLEVKRVVDVTAHIGVDTIHFAQLFPHATLSAFEVVGDAFLALRQNMIRFGMQDRVHVEYRDSSDWIPTEPIDIVYMDPPWGGRDYYKKACLELFLQKESDEPMTHKNINYMIDTWMNTSLIQHLIVKVPTNFNKSYLLRRYRVDVAIIEGKKRTAYELLHIQPMISFLYKQESDMTLWSVPYITESYDPIFMNTKAALVRIPSELVAKETIEMNISYFINVPFSYQKPRLLDKDELYQAAIRHGFVFSRPQVIAGNLYFLFIKHEEARTESKLEFMKKYHNIEKKLLIIQYTKNKSVLDLGAGFGGDLLKYQESKVKRLILVEPSVENLVTLKGRLDHMKETEIYPITTLVNAKGQELDKIRPFINRNYSKSFIETI